MGDEALLLEDNGVVLCMPTPLGKFAGRCKAEFLHHFRLIARTHYRGENFNSTRVFPGNLADYSHASRLPMLWWWRRERVHSVR